MQVSLFELHRFYDTRTLRKFCEQSVIFDDFTKN